jgi:hypothetical protein
MQRCCLLEAQKSLSRLVSLHTSHTGSLATLPRAHRVPAAKPGQRRVRRRDAALVAARRG